MNNKRQIIIGLDGVPYQLLKDLAEKQVMPAVGKLIEEGSFSKMASSLPEVSSVAWSSIITGANPAEHGIFGFTDFRPNSRQLYFPQFHDLKVPAFWNRNHNKKYIIMNVPSTYPARPLNGMLISGFVSPDTEKAIYPHSLVQEMLDLGYRIDVESSLAHESMEKFIKDLFDTLDKRMEAYRYLWAREWDLFMLVVTGTDRLMHFLMDAYYDQGHKYHRVFLDYFCRVDALIAEICSNLSESDSLLMLSDHGFELLETDVYVNNILKENRFLGAVEEWEDIGPDSSAFAMDPARIYAKGHKGVIKDLEALFKGLVFNGKKVIKHVYRKEEIYSGPLMLQAPDLVLVGEKGMNLKASLKSRQSYGKGIFNGKHTHDDAFIILRNKAILPEQMSVTDVLGVINEC